MSYGNKISKVISLVLYVYLWKEKSGVFRYKSPASPVAASSRPFCGLCLWLTSINLSWSFLQLVFSDLGLLGWHSGLKNGRLYPGRTLRSSSSFMSCQALRGILHGKTQSGAEFPWPLVPLSLHNSSGIKPFPGSLSTSSFSLPGSPTL